jgi:hypothetical protein
MTFETISVISAIIFGLLDVVLFIYQWKEKNRIKAKQEIWNKDIQSIVNISAKMQERIDKNIIQDPKELRSGIEAIGAFANGIHISLKEELKIID